LGDAPSAKDVTVLVERYRNTAAVRDALERVRASWDRLSATLTVHTPDSAFDVMINRWLPYQALSSRIRGRSAFYQSSGAYGFRDQLQDVLAFLVLSPSIAREQILKACSRQFDEGDVQHWWHEPSGAGVRTHFSDDRLWLVYAVSEWVKATS